MSTVREVVAAEYGEDWTKESYRFGISHVATFYEGSYNSNYKDLLIVGFTKANDCFGYDDAVEVSNYRVLQKQWEDIEGLGRGPWSNCDVIALEVDSEAPEDLIEVLNGLADYPVIDEQEWSNVEQEFIQEHWDSYGKSDVLDAVAKAIGLDSSLDLTAAAQDIVESLVWEGILDYGSGGGYPTMIDVSAVDFGYKEIAEYIKANYGNMVKVNTGDMWRDERTFDLTKANLVYLPEA